MNAKNKLYTYLLVLLLLAVSGQSVLAQPTVTITNGSSVSICAGSNVILATTVSGAAPITYLWSTTATTSSLTISSAGTYSVTVTELGGLTATASTSVTINPLPTGVAGSNSPLCVGSTLHLTASGGTAYSWSGPLMVLLPSFKIHRSAMFRQRQVEPIP